MKILFIEDDDNKRESICNFLRISFPSIVIDCGMSVESGVQLAVDNSYNLVLLDMTIPNFDKKGGRNGGNSFKNGGEIIIKELIDECIIFKCAIITQYETFNNETIDQISNRVRSICGSNYKGFIKYNKLDDEWKDNLKKIIKDVKNTID